MDDEAKDALRHFRNWIIGMIVTVLLLGGVATIISRAFDLAWMPWEVKMRTHIIRNSNSYVTTQQTALRQLYTDALGAQTEAQRLAIVAQMRQIADLIPDSVPVDISGYLARNH